MRAGLKYGPQTASCPYDARYDVTAVDRRKTSRNNKTQESESNNDDADDNSNKSPPS
jgi:hypothetical protein